MWASSRFFAVVLALLLVLYPLLVYFGVQEFGPRILAAILLIVAAIKLVITKFARQTLGNSGWLLLAAAIACGVTLATGSVIGLKFYPVVVNLILFGVFALSLWNPPSMIERFARLQTQELPMHAIPYTRKVTWIWCGFFIVNGSIAVATVFTNDKIWALYNGLLSYIFMGILLVGEYVVRLAVQKQYTQLDSNTLIDDNPTKAPQHKKIRLSK